MNRHYPTAQPNAKRVPRASGDEPKYFGVYESIQGCSPRQRG